MIKNKSPWDLKRFHDRSKPPGSSRFMEHWSSLPMHVLLFFLLRIQSVRQKSICSQSSLMAEKDKQGHLWWRAPPQYPSVPSTAHSHGSLMSLLVLRIWRVCLRVDRCIHGGLEEPGGHKKVEPFCKCLGISKKSFDYVSSVFTSAKIQPGFAPENLLV